jgi:hypothetical protein
MAFSDITNNALGEYNKFTSTDDGLFSWSRKPVYSFNKGINRWNEYNDPTYLGFVFMFDWINSPLLNDSDTSTNTAVSYLMRNGETLRATYLKQFIECLKSINYNMPWYWQSFEGGENLWKYNGFKEPYKGGEDSVLNIECLESIDLKVTLLMDLYRKAVYDQTYKRIIIPENLRKFEMYIYVQEVRKFQVDKFVELQNKIAAVNIPNVTNPVPGGKSTILMNRNENSPYVMWLLKFCEFDPDAAASPFVTLGMAHGDSAGFAKQKISIKYELVEEPGNFYPLIDGTVSSTAPNVEANNSFSVNKFEDAGPDDVRSLVQKAKDSAKQRLVDSAKAEAFDFAQGKINSLLLGNVYGVGNEVRAALQQGSIQSLGPGLINTISSSTKKEDNAPNDLGNAFK